MKSETGSFTITVRQNSNPCNYPATIKNHSGTYKGSSPLEKISQTYSVYGGSP